jgi:nucleotidyltransferase substrate binding protein (TIGR01987 family)
MNLMMAQLILTPLKKAIASLKKVLAQPKNEFIRDTAIQRFEYTYELSWKMLKRYLTEEAGIEEFNIKNLFRVAARIGLIDNVESWFKYQKARNLTPHTYNEKTAEETFNIVQQFLPDAEKLLVKLGAVDNSLG